MQRMDESFYWNEHSISVFSAYNSYIISTYMNMIRVEQETRVWLCVWAGESNGGTN